MSRSSGRGPRPGQFRYGCLQEAADVCGGRGRLWVLNAFLVLRGDGSIAIDGDGGQICGWFTGPMLIAALSRFADKHLPVPWPKRKRHAETSGEQLGDEVAHAAQGVSSFADGCADANR